jgi:hypothetical protein
MIMNRPAKIIGFAFVLMPSVLLAQSASSPASQTVIYKHVDEQGRVTYANSPIKGGARVELEPLTVIPSTPTGSLNPAGGRTQATAPTPAPTVATVTPPAKSSAASLLSNAPAASAPVAAPTAAPAIQVASVLPLSSATAAAKTPAPVTIASAEPTSLETINQLTQQRRDETRKRLLEGELQTEEQMLIAAKSKLAEEQKNSTNIRAMRASFSPTAETATAQKPLIAPETRAEIERHFERVRNLQDQVAMHENHLQGLREQLTKLR